MPEPRRRLTYANVMSTLAVFLVLGGGAALAAGLAKNSVKSKQVKDDSLRAVDLKDGEAVGGAEVIDNGLKGADIDESSLAIPSGPADNSVGSAQIAPDAVGNSELDLRAVGAENFAGFAVGNVNFSAVAAQRCTHRDIDLTNLAGDSLADNAILVSPNDAFGGEFAVSGHPLDNNTVRVNVCNNSPADTDPDGAGSTLRVIAVDFPD